MQRSGAFVCVRNIGMNIRMNTKIKTVYGAVDSTWNHTLKTVRSRQRALRQFTLHSCVCESDGNDRWYGKNVGESKTKCGAELM